MFGSPNLGHALNGTHIQDGKPYSTDFVCFIYLDTVRPGDGGLLLVPGSFKSNFERPATMFGPYGRAHHGPPEGIAPEQGHVSPAMQPGVVPEHTVNVCPQAGDIVKIKYKACLLPRMTQLGFLPPKIHGFLETNC